MKLLTYNCRGLASSPKKIAIKRLLLTNQQDIIFLQETLSDEEVATKMLSTLLPGWAFMDQSPKGKSGELVIGWRSRRIKLINSWAMDYVLGGDFLLEGIGKEFRIINIYGPHTDQNTF